MFAPVRCLCLFETSHQTNNQKGNIFLLSLTCRAVSPLFLDIREDLLIVKWGLPLSPPWTQVKTDPRSAHLGQGSLMTCSPCLNVKQRSVVSTAVSAVGRVGGLRGGCAGVAWRLCKGSRARSAHGMGPIWWGAAAGRLSSGLTHTASRGNAGAALAHNELP